MLLQINALMREHLYVLTEIVLIGCFMAHKQFAYLIALKVKVKWFNFIKGT